jgi:FAD/FMN-containing dehydrogenase
MKTMPPALKTLERFAAIVGPDHAIFAPEAMQPYLREWRDRWFGKAAAVLRPGSVENPGNRA